MPRYTREQLMAVDVSVLRTHLRERVHHTLEHQVYSAVFGERKLSDTFGSIVREVLDVCAERGLPDDLPEIVWARTLLDLADRARAGEKVEPSGATAHVPYEAAELESCEKMILGRRSYRHWDGRPVPRELVEKTLEAGLWAANGCNMQSCRFIVIEDPEILRKFKNSEFGIEQVKIVCCLDVRGYRGPEGRGKQRRNELLDVGACMQNMALMAHALGLGGCWSTFSEEQITGIHQHFDLPACVEVVTYLALGWPAEKVVPPARMAVADAVLAWS
ncbi:MAG: nitroreductase family protein [Planctomycetota bacterium]|jgi:nitroreductase